MEITQDRVMPWLHSYVTPTKGTISFEIDELSNGQSAMCIKTEKLRCLLITINFICPDSITEDPKRIDCRRRSKFLVVSSTNFLMFTAAVCILQENFKNSE